MTIKTTLIKDEVDWEGDIFVLHVDGKEVIRVGRGEPEDNTIARDLRFVRDLPALLEKAWQAGKDGEDFNGTKEALDYKTYSDNNYSL